MEWQRVDRVMGHWLKGEVNNSLRRIIVYNPDLIHGIRRDRLTCFVRADHRRRQGDWRISRNNMRRGAGHIWIGVNEPRSRSIECSGWRRGICHWRWARKHRRRGLRRDKRHTGVILCLSLRIWVKRSGTTRGAKVSRNQFFARK